HRPATAGLWELGLCLLAGAGVTLLLVRAPSWWSALIALGMVAGVWAGCEWALLGTGILLSPMPATAALAFNSPALTLLNYLLEKKRADRVEEQLAETRERSRRALEESEARYRRLVENINDAIIEDDAEGRLVFASRRFREWFGIEGEEIRGIALEDYAAPEWRDGLREQRTRQRAGGGAPEQYEFEALRPGGGRIWIEALVTRIEEDGRVLGTQSALRDVTERKRIEAQYLQAQKMDTIGKLAGMVAHDFNNLLTVINGYCDFVLSGPQTEKDYQGILTEIRSAGEKATELTRN